MDRALSLIEEAKEAGAHAAKFQNFVASKIVSRKGFESLGNRMSHQSSWKKSVFDVYDDASVSKEWTAKLKAKCDEVGIEYFTSPYDFDSVDHVDPYVNAYKVGSGDITWTEIIQFMARKGKPLLIASGASSMEDVDRAMAVLLPMTDRVCLMQCNTNYTADPKNFHHLNLNVLTTFRQKYPSVVLGLSDHTHGHASVVASIGLGATVFEKHFTDDNGRDGPDHKFAMNPSSWREMVARSQEAFNALGDGIKRVEANEVQTAMLQRRALRFTKDLPKGHVLTESDLFPLRPIPEDGLPPYELAKILGKRLAVNATTDSHIRWSDVEKN